MKILLRTIDSANAPATERSLEVTVLKIGRGADQHIVLGDLRLALAHAELLPHQGLLNSGVQLQARGRIGIKVNGAPQASATLISGDVLDFGRYSLTVGDPRDDFDLVLTLQERLAAHEERSARKAAFKTTLADTGWSRRRLSWLLFTVLALTTLALPLLHYFLQPPAQPGAGRALVTARQIKSDIVWNSGPLSSAHQALTADCGVCHQQPFVPVRDDSCKSCHADLRDHASSAQLAAQQPFAEQRCSDCHREHNGPQGLIPVANAVCTTCHAEPEQLPGKPGLPTSDFSKTHPAFSLRLARKAPAGSREPFIWQQVRQGTAAAGHEDTGLKFPHDVHLLKKGIDAPEGLRKLACNSCHVPTSDHSSFLPVQMETHCADCHRLDFDPQQPQRLLPHGDPDAAAQTVRDHYARLALAGGVLSAGAPAVVSERRRPGETLSPPRAQAALAWADAEAQKTLIGVFEKRSCHICHSVERQSSEPLRWQIAAVAAQKPAFSALVFPHDAHQTETCASCHASADSKHSEEVLLPDIKRCRDCHGDTGALVETAASCQSCHAYHLHPGVAALVPAQSLTTDAKKLP